ncbi:MAG: hydroxyacid dehydrogenase [Dehalococcoidales bacterium]|nr:hydroxyacid dehydrogenase [Dehalococcoidales bacterium]
MKITLFEIEDWEREHFQKGLPEHELSFHRDPLGEDTAVLAADSEAVSVFIYSPVSRNVIQALPKLRFIATRSTGYDHIDLGACKERGITVSNVPRYGENTVAEHTFGLILTLSRNILKAYLRTTRGDFSLRGLEGFDIMGKTLGVVGAGSIGLHVIRIAKGFGMNVLAYDVRPNRLIAEVLGFEYASLDDLLAQSDIVTLHAPYLPSTHHLINRESLAKIKRGALLINTARGALLDTEALLWALDEGILGGAGLDVLEGEELITEESRLLTQPTAEEKLRMLLRQHILLRRENVVITPHSAFYSKEALQRIIDTTIANVQCYAEGQPQNVVSG